MTTPVSPATTPAARRGRWWQLPLLALAYLGGGLLGLAVPYLDPHISLIWPPTGIAVAGLWRWGWRCWPGVWLGALGTSLWTGLSPGLAAAVACGSTLGPLLTVYALRQLGFTGQFKRRRELPLLLFAILVGMAITASNGTLLLSLDGRLAAGELGSAWLLWWLGDAVGALLVGLPLLTLNQPGLERSQRRRQGLETLLLLSALLGCAAFTFLTEHPLLLGTLLLFPPPLLLALLAARSGVWAASSSALAFAAVAAGGTALGYGPLHYPDLQSGLSLLWAYSTTQIVLVLVVHTLIGEMEDRDRRWAAALAGAATGIWEWDCDSGAMQHSPHLATMLGYPSATLLTHVSDWENLLHPDDRDHSQRALHRHLIGETADYRAEVRLRRQDGLWQWVQLRGQVTESSADGEALRLAGTVTDISELKEREEWLGIMERALEAAQNGVVIADARLPDQPLIFVNPAFELLSGYHRSEILGRNCRFLQGEDRDQPGIAAMAAAVRRGEECQTVVRNYRPDGRLFWNEISLSPVFNNRGELTHYIGIQNDISERVTAQEQLERRDALLRKLSEQLPGFIYQYRYHSDGHSSFPYASEGIRHIYEVTPEAVQQSAEVVFALLHPEDRPRVAASIRESARALTPWHEEYRVCLPRQGTCWREGWARPERQADGSVLWHGYITDISSRKAMETHLRLSASVFENAHEGILITDPAGHILDVNRAFERLTGYAREEVLGKNPSLLKSGRQGGEFYTAMWRGLQQQGYWQGEVWNRRKDGEAYVELLAISAVCDSSGKLLHYVGVFSDITQLKEHQQRLERMAHYDALTQLPNRVLLADRLQLAVAQTERGGQLLAVVYLDLDGFKPVNDLHGHEAGDQLLIEVANRLRKSVRAGDTVARLGGDEFVLLINQLAHVEECGQLLERILASLAMPYELNGFIAQVSASIGVTLCPLDNADPETLLRHADQAMYEAKQAGRNRFHLFDPEHDRRARQHHEALSRIELALRQREFCLYYQPKVDMRHGRVFGAEALLRWQHPERGLVSPGEFLPLVDDSDFAPVLGDWVLAEAITQAASWHRQGRPLIISVNIAGRHLQREDFADRLAELLAAHPDLPPAHLELEILETTALEDIASVTRIIARCRELGVLFALDDFGTGYSSLSYFKQLPVNVMKIDQSFIRDMLDDPDDLAIVDGVIGLTRAFHRQVIAEGVESAEHGALLLRLGCEQAQGYGIARPMPASHLGDWIDQWRPSVLWNPSALSRWSREHLELFRLGLEHRRWVDQLLALVAQPDAPLPSLPDNPHDCRFGHWYDGPCRARYGEQPTYPFLGATHELIHLQGDLLLEHLRHGRREDARAQIGDLLLLRERLVEELFALQNEALSSGA